jgi:hypothetical protein
MAMASTLPLNAVAADSMRSASHVDQHAIAAAMHLQALVYYCELVNLCVWCVFLVLWLPWFAHMHVPSFVLAVCCPPRATLSGPAADETKGLFHWLCSAFGCFVTGDDSE